MLKNSPAACRLIAVALGCALLVACGAVSPAAQAVPADSLPEQRDLILATTTSTQDSGLLDELIPAFERDSGYVVKVIAVGSGQALKMGEQGNADVLLVHAPSAEQEFMDKGFGAERRLVMHNDFVLVGPPADPADVNGFGSPVDALRHIAVAGALYVSRADDSGTHKLERQLWAAAGIAPARAWYLETGQGMAATLRVASERAAYTLTDRATFVAQRDTLDLTILVEGHSSLLNVYHVVTVNPVRWPYVNQAGARALADFLTSVEGQRLIGSFGVLQYGQPLFIPDAGKSAADLRLEE